MNVLAAPPLAGLIQEPSDALMLAVGIERMTPVFSDQTASFCALHYRLFKIAFKDELLDYWDDVLDLLEFAAQANPGEAAHDTRIMASAIASLRRLMGDAEYFRAMWPRINRIGQGTGKNGANVLIRLADFLFELNITSAEHIDTLVGALERFAGQENALKLLGTNILGKISALEKDTFPQHWPEIKAFLEDLDTAGVSSLGEILSHWDWPFNNLQELQTALREVNLLRERFPTEDLPLAWFIQTQWGHLADSDMHIREFIAYLRITGAGETAAYQIFLLLRDVAPVDWNDYRLAVCTANDLLQRYPPQKMLDIKRKILFQIPLDPAAFCLLYPMMIERHIPLTMEVIQRWQEIFSAMSPLPHDSIPDDQLVSRVREHYRPAVEEINRIYPQKPPDLIHVLARVTLQSAEQARKFAELLAQDNGRTFIRLGALKDPDGNTLLAADPAMAQRTESYTRAFESTDNLFLVPVRNPLAYRDSTIHGRSAVVNEALAGDSLVQAVGKGVGLEESARREGIASAYTNGEGVYKLLGGIDATQTAFVQNAEGEMRGAFRQKMQNSDWRDWSDFFGIQENTFFIQNMVEFQPLALPVCFTDSETKERFRDRTVALPGLETSFGLEYIQPQALWKRLGLDVMGGFDHTVVPTATLQRISYYLSPDATRLSEMQAFKISPEGLNAPYKKILNILGIQVQQNAADAIEPLVFTDRSGRRLPERLVRQYLFLGLVARTALLADILHHDLAGTGSNEYGSMFFNFNMSLITAFDYDTAITRGISPDIPETVLKLCQKEDTEAILNPIKDGLIPFSLDLLGGATLFDLPPNWNTFWQMLYEGRLDEALHMLSGSNSEAGHWLTEFVNASRESRAQPKEPEAPRACDAAL